jgi:hypothetical protein
MTTSGQGCVNFLHEASGDGKGTEHASAVRMGPRRPVKGPADLFDAESTTREMGGFFL